LSMMEGSVAACTLASAYSQARVTHLGAVFERD
jgi:hypothetical protein